YPEGRFDGYISGRYTAWVRTSDDRGRTWSERRQVDTAPYPYGSPYGKIVSLSDGTLLMNVYTWHQADTAGEKLPPEKQGDFSCLLRSEDGGLTWLPAELIARHFNETALAVMENDVVLAVMRDEAGGLSHSLSKDRGRTWSAPLALLSPPQHPADCIRLASGRLLLAFGHRKPPLGVQAIWSDDNGTSWSFPRRALLEGSAANGDCGYPSSVQLADGTIVTMYYGVGHRELADLGEYAIAVRYREEDLAGMATADVGDRKQLFLDAELVDKTDNIRWSLNPPEKVEGPLLKSDRPWEAFVASNYPTVIRDGDEFKLWYEAYSDFARGDFGARLCYATSSDGRHWTKPELNLVEFDGSKTNNIVYPNGPFKYHGGSVFVDPAAAEAERYKLVSMGEGGLAGAVSGDGIHWKRLEQPIVAGLESDTQNVCYWDAELGRYVLYCRLWTDGEIGQGLRAIGRSESPDFRTFPMPTFVMKPDESDPERHDLYNNAAMKYPYAAGAHLIFTSVFNQPADTLEVQLATSRDGIRWTRHREPLWLARGKPEAFDSMCLYQAPGGVRHGDELYFYYAGFNVGHNAQLPDKVQKSGGLGLAVLRLDGFRSAGAGPSGGTLTTLPVIFSGKRLVINASGHVRVALLSAGGEPIAGHTLDECEPFDGDSVRHQVQWNGNGDLSELIGQPVRLHFELRDARLYAFQFEAE
ncbi:MAG: exo-alpha-sialidase, partial [Pirellulales bacterium]